MDDGLDPNQVDEDSHINDIREDFRCITFSNYKMTQVKTKLLENMVKGKIEETCNWTAELVCSGHFLEIWETILLYYGKHIHLGNPKLAVYLDNRYNIFKNIISQSIFTSMLQLRNNEKIRKLFSEINTMMCLSLKSHSIELIKINRVEEFDITQMTERLKAPNVEYIEPIFQKKDPKELFIAINEFSYNICAGSTNTLNACYWIEWIIEFEQICKNKKQPCLCERRNQYNVEHKYQMDVIWMIWDALFYYCKNQMDEYTLNILKSVLHLFCIKYTTATTKKRRYLLYMAVGLVASSTIENTNKNVELINKENKILLATVTNNINHIYKEIKKNENNPKTDYLFTGLKKQSKKNIENSLKKMDMLNSIMATEMKEPNQLIMDNLTTVVLEK